MVQWCRHNCCDGVYLVSEVVKNVRIPKCQESGSALDNMKKNSDMVGWRKVQVQMSSSSEAFMKGIMFEPDSISQCQGNQVPLDVGNLMLLDFLLELANCLRVV